MPWDELAVLADMGRRLEGAGLGYMLTGSMALQFYAIPRMTRDIDLVIAIDDADLLRLKKAFEDTAYYADMDMAKSGQKTGTPFNFIHLESMIKIDLIPRKKSVYRIQEFERRIKKPITDTLSVWVVSAEDLILSKLEWSIDTSSEVQRRDIRSLVQNIPDLDWPYLDTWAQKMGLFELLHDIKGRAS